MLNLILYEQILEQQKNNNLALKDVPFYQIEKDGHRAFLLGTSHSLDLSFMPKYVLDKFKQLNRVFTEAVIIGNEDLERSLLKELLDIYKKGSKFDWHTVLDINQIECLHKCLKDHYNVHIDANKIDFSLMDLPIKFIYRVVVSDINATYQAHIKIRPDIQIMDQQLWHLFYNNCFALEPDYGYIDNYNDLIDQEDIDFLRGPALSFLKKYENWISLTKDEMESLLSSVSKIIDFSTIQTILSFYQNVFYLAYSAYIDNWVSDGNLSLYIRNLIMFHKIEDSLNQNTRDLFAMGVGHLFGSLGMLEIMTRKGYKISKVTPSGLEPLDYQYKQYLKSYNIIKQDILGTRKKPTLRALS